MKATGGIEVPLVFLALDANASRQCERSTNSAGNGGIRCVEAPRRLGVEGVIAKYLALATITRLGMAAVWLDIDVYVANDPTPAFRHALQDPVRHPELLFARHLTSESLSPAVLVARGSPEATGVLLSYAGWLRENPYLLDHQGWDQFLDNRAGDFSGGFDYQGRNVTVENDTGPFYSFLPKDKATSPGVPYAKLGNVFGSGDGWLEDSAAKGSNLDGPTLFHFWGAIESQDELFELLYPHQKPGYPSRAKSVLAQYRRVLTSGPQLSTFLGRGRGGDGKRLHLVSVSYADGCCWQSLRKNRRQALAVGVDEARAYGRKDLGPDWVAQHSKILSQRRGGGWWLWKPYVILRALKDPSLPWHRGVVIWVDAGNYLHADPRPLVKTALDGSDVSAMRLKWCLEADWTSATTLQRLNVSGRYAVVDRPQLGAYFLLFRKTELAISFVEEWLRLSEDRETLLGAEAANSGDLAPALAPTASTALAREMPSFQKHQADQSIFSVLFKEHGFHAMTLEDGHKVVTLARWRE